MVTWKGRNTKPSRKRIEKMYRADVVLGVVEERETVAHSECVVYFMDGYVKTRENSEKKDTRKYGWALTEKAAYGWLIERTAANLVELNQQTETTRKNLGALRRTFRKRFEEKPDGSRVE